MSVNLQQTYVGFALAKGRQINIRPVAGSSTLGIDLLYSISPVLPDGLGMNPGTGFISGKPMVDTDLVDFTITVNEISLPDFIFNDVISANIQNYNLRDRATFAGWTNASRLKATVTVSQNTVISSPSASLPAFTTADLPPETNLILNVDGKISGFNGTFLSNSGGTALNVTVPTVAKIRTNTDGSAGIIGGSGYTSSANSTYAQNNTGEAGKAIIGGHNISWASGNSYTSIYGSIDSWGMPVGIGWNYITIAPYGYQGQSFNSILSSESGKMYWKSVAASVDSPRETIKVFAIYDNVTGSDLIVKLRGLVDDYSSKYAINGNVVNTSTPWADSLAYRESDQITLIPGINVIEVFLTNAEVAGNNPAGYSLTLIMSSDSSVLISSEQWKIEG